MTFLDGARVWMRFRKDGSSTTQNAWPVSTTKPRMASSTFIWVIHTCELLATARGSEEAGHCWLVSLHARAGCRRPRGATLLLWVVSQEGHEGILLSLVVCLHVAFEVAPGTGISLQQTRPVTTQLALVDDANVVLVCGFAGTTSTLLTLSWSRLLVSPALGTSRTEWDLRP